MVYVFDIPLIEFIKSKLVNACCFSTKPDYETSLFLLAVASETRETQK